MAKDKTIDVSQSLLSVPASMNTYGVKITRRSTGSALQSEESGNATSQGQKSIMGLDRISFNLPNSDVDSRCRNDAQPFAIAKIWAFLNDGLVQTVPLISVKFWFDFWLLTDVKERRIWNCTILRPSFSRWIFAFICVWNGLLDRWKPFEHHIKINDPPIIASYQSIQTKIVFLPFSKQVRLFEHHRINSPKLVLVYLSQLLQMILNGWMFNISTLNRPIGLYFRLFSQRLDVRPLKSILKFGPGNRIVLSSLTNHTSGWATDDVAAQNGTAIIYAGKCTN